MNPNTINLQQPQPQKRPSNHLQHLPERKHCKVAPKNREQIDVYTAIWCKRGAPKYISHSLLVLNDPLKSKSAHNLKSFFFIFRFFFMSVLKPQITRSVDSCTPQPPRSYSFLTPPWGPMPQIGPRQHVSPHTLGFFFAEPHR